MSIAATKHDNCPTCTCASPLPGEVFATDVYDAFSKLPWIDAKERPFPIFDRNKEGIDHDDFLAAWIIDGHVEGIEWYTYLGDGEFWNQNSNNLNTFNNDHELPIHREPTHWLPVPRGNRSG